MNSAQAVSEDSVPARRKRRLGVGGCLLILGGFLALLVLVPFALYWTWARSAEKRVEAQLAEIRAAGEPTTPEELDAYYTYPPEQEDVTELLLAAIRDLDTPAFTAAAENLPIVGMDEREIPPPGQDWEKLDAARQLLEQYARPLEQLHEAAERGGKARFPVQFEDGFDMLIEHAQQLRTAARLLALEAHVRAHDGDAAGAARSIRALLSLARSLENEPVLVSQLVLYACDGVAYGLIDDFLPHVEFSDQDLAMLQRELRRGEIAEGLKRSLVGERVMGIDAIRRPEELAEVTDIPAVPGLAGLRHHDMALYIETMSEYVEAAEQPWPEARAQAEQAALNFEATADGSPIQRARYMMSNLLLPALEAAMVAGARTDAERAVVDTAIAFVRYQRQNGQPPEKLEQLVPQYLPAVPDDPFSGQPIKYLLTDEEIVIYSVGRDATDNGGQGDLAGDPDLVVRLPRTK